MRDGGAALVIDYGHAQSAVGDTLQAVGRHAYADPLSAPGTIDLTAHVDFQALASAVEAMGVNGYGPVTQSQFLRRLGIVTRAASLKTKVAGRRRRHRRRAQAPDQRGRSRHGRAVQGRRLRASLARRAARIRGLAHAPATQAGPQHIG